MCREWFPYGGWWVGRDRRGSADKLNWRRPHTLPPEALYLAHLAPHLQQTQSTLNAKLQTTQLHNVQLMETIGEQRAEIERLVGGLEGVVQDLKAAKEAVSGVVGDGELGREILDIDQELKAVQ